MTDSGASPDGGRAGVDAGLPDGGVEDSGIDSGVVDGGATDAGMDAGLNDAGEGTTDAGAEDSGVPDGGTSGPDAGWVLVSASGGPGPRTEFGMSFDDSYGLAILFGGALSSGPANDTWQWDGSSWAQVSTTSTPSPRYAVELAYDEAHQVSVLFSGDPGFPSYPSDTWTYSPGSGWTQANVVGPAGRRSYALAYDSARQSTILYGGWGGGSTTSNFFPETWEWDGGSTGWVERASTGPPGLFRPAMAFDDATGEMVLYGGATNAVNTCAAAQTGTWGWDGTSGAWTQKSPVHSPPPLAGHTMVYDSRRQKIVMFGGCTTTEFSDQVWEWDGADWTQVMLSGPSARWLHGMAFSTSSGMSVLFGGSNGAVSLGDTWNYWGP